MATDLRASVSLILAGLAAETGEMAESGEVAIESDSAVETDLPAASEPVPEELDELVHRCVAKDPTQRPVSVSELIHVLRAIAVHHPWTRDDAQAWWREHAPADGGGPAGVLREH